VSRFGRPLASLAEERGRDRIRQVRSWSGPVWFWLFLALTVTGLHLWHPDGAVGAWTYLAVGIGASVAAWIGAARAAPDRVAGRLVALGVTLSSSGDVIYQLFVWFGSSAPDVSLADVFWLSSYLALSAALLRILRLTHDVRGAFRDGLIDVAVIAVLVLLLEWEVSVETLVADASSPILSRVVWALYPACDALLIALLVRVVTTRHHLGAMSVLFGAGALCWLLSDFGYALMTWTDSLGPWLDTGWLLGALFLGVSTWQRSVESHDHPDQERQRGHVSLALGLLPLLAPGAIELVGWVNGTDANPVPLMAATVLLVLLAFLRGVGLLGSRAHSQELLRSQARYASAVAANSSDAVLVIDEAGLILNDAHQFAALLGSPGAPTRGISALQFFTPVDPSQTDAAFRRAMLAPGAVFEDEFEVLRADGAEMWIGIRIVNLFDDPDIAGMVVNIHETTHRKDAERELAHQALHDALTGLPNRALFTDRVEQALRRDRRSRLDPAVIYLDLDGFKAVNDSLGHDAGDLLLCEISRRLLNAVRTGDAVTRLGADEFAVLVEQSSRPLDEAEEVVRRILQALDVPVEVEGQLVTLSASVGIAVADGESTASSLLRDADVAMYRAKASGKSRSVVYEPAMREAAVERLRLESDLVHAMVTDQFRLDYQPVMSLATDRIVGFEALLRWDHPELGIVAPDKFIPIAEDTGLIVPIGRWVLGEACRQAAQWRAEMPDVGDISMAVNVSGRQMASANLGQHVAQALAASGLPPALLVLELTESVLVHDPDLAARRLQELRGLGIRLAVDDFGTGYSSLSYLRQFPFDILKVDKSFVATITDAEAIPAIVRGLLDLGRTLGLETVAEGVEDVVQRDALRTHGCDLAQGYLFARPMNPANARSMLTNAESIPVAARQP
jgi:diguanylate cyclase (GGDEF)-like protein/PAS domain S-box-containing protein